MLLAACAVSPPAPVVPPPVVTPPGPVAAPEPDDDLEGLLALADRCPDEVGPHDGCGDDDWITLGDACPGQPETENGYRDADGCPDDAPDDYRRLEALSRDLLFPPVGRDGVRTGAKLTARAKRALREAAEILRAYPELRLLAFGFIDEFERQAYFHRSGLPRLRVDAVVDYLVAQGIAADRVEAHWGDWNVASNDTAAGRAKNRRVELMVLTR